MHATRGGSLSGQVQLEGPLSCQRKSDNLYLVVPDSAKVFCVECYPARLGVRGVLTQDDMQLACCCEDLNDKDVFNIR